MKERTTSSSPSGRHISHYNVLAEMEDDSMLWVIYQVLYMSMKYGIVLCWYFKVATTLLKKEIGKPRIHQL